MSSSVYNRNGLVFSAQAQQVATPPGGLNKIPFPDNIFIDKNDDGTTPFNLQVTGENELTIQATAFIEFLLTLDMELVGKDSTDSITASPQVKLLNGLNQPVQVPPLKNNPMGTYKFVDNVNSADIGHTYGKLTLIIALSANSGDPNNVLKLRFAFSPGHSADDSVIIRSRTISYALLTP